MNYRFLLAAAVIPFVLYSCTKNETSNVNEPSSLSVSAITLNPTSVTINEGETATISATISPSNASNQKVIWSSSDASVATVSDGKVTGISKGSATITATADDNGKTAQCSVTVNAKSGGDNGGGNNGSDDDNPSATIQLPSEISRTGGYFANLYTFTYKKEGVISSLTRELTDDEDYTDIDNYEFTFTSQSLTIKCTDTYSQKTYTRKLSNGYIKSYTEDTTKYDFEYDSDGYLTKITETSTYGGKSTVAGIIVFTWNNECLIKVVNTMYHEDDYPEVQSTYEITYGSDLNPYFGYNFEPFSLIADVIDVYPYTPCYMLGLYGHNSKYLAKSFKHKYIDAWDGETQHTDNCTVNYQYSDGLLSGITQSYSAGDVYTYTIINKVVN